MSIRGAFLADYDIAYATSILSAVRVSIEHLICINHSGMFVRRCLWKALVKNSEANLAGIFFHRPRLLSADKLQGS